jgi:tetratricopeptide (TPR) repeat protein
MSRGAYPMANRAIQIALKSEPENVDALTLAGQINHDLDNFEGSIEHFEKSLKLRPKNVEASTITALR